VLACVVNVSEGRDAGVLAALDAAAGRSSLDRHTDPHHHRSVFTLAGPQVEEAARALARVAVERIDLRRHDGAHPRLGALDVVPFVPLAGSTMDDAVGARDRFATWAGDELALPCFVYGPERSLPDVRRSAFTTVPPDRGPTRAHPTAGACAVGARPVLVAYNVWLAADASPADARRVAAAVRDAQRGVRALGLEVGGRAQVSMNLTDPSRCGPADAYDAVARLATIGGAELVGLVPEAVLAAIPPVRWAELDLARSRTIEARLREAGLDGGRS
jgi:glutamate formiminotransferase